MSAACLAAFLALAQPCSGPASSRPARPEGTGPGSKVVRSVRPSGRPDLPTVPKGKGRRAGASTRPDRAVRTRPTAPAGRPTSAGRPGGSEAPVSPPTRASMAASLARDLVHRIGLRSGEGIAALCKVPFDFDGRLVSKPSEISRLWQAAINKLDRQARGRPLASRFRVVPSAEARKVFGRVPGRIAATARKAQMVIALRLGRRSLFLLAAPERSGRWLLIGVTD